MVRAASVVVLDTSLSDEQDFDQACTVCEQLLLNKLVDTPAEEVAVVLAGTPGAFSTLREASQNQRYHHITVCEQLQRVSRESLTCLAAARVMRQHDGFHSFDLVEALAVATAVLQAKTIGKSYHRTIYFVTDARHNVVHRADLANLLYDWTTQPVALVVVGFGFFNPLNEGGAAVASLIGLHTKAQNEQILTALCAERGPPSKIVTPAEMLRSLQQLRVRPVQQRALIRVVLRIGDVGIATQMFTLAKIDDAPPLQQGTRDGATVTQTVTYEVACEGPREKQTRVVEKEALREAAFFGGDRVLCDTTSVEAMTMKGPRALEAIVFVPEAEIEPFVLMGGTRTLLPLAGDHAGQRGYHAMTDAMQATKTAMLLRLVYRRDAAPQVWACFVQEGNSEVLPRYLVMAPLPFQEDNRAFTFSEYAELRFTTPEQQLMDDLIDGLSVDDAVLAPEKMLNPVVQQFYATLKAKLADGTTRSSTATATAAGAAPAVVKIPPLLPALRGTSTDFFVEGGVVQCGLLKCRDVLSACVATFPYEEGEGTASLDRQDNMQNAKGHPSPSTTSHAPSTVAAAVVSNNRRKTGDGAEAEGTPSLSSVTSERGTASTAPHIIPNSGVTPGTGGPEKDSAAATLILAGALAGDGKDAVQDEVQHSGGDDWLAGIR